MSSSSDQKELIDLTAEQVVNYGSIRSKPKKSHSKGKAGAYLQQSPRRINNGPAGNLEWVNWLIDHRDTDFFRRMMGNLQELRRKCIVKDPDHLQCMLTDVVGNDHRRTSTEAYREMIERYGDRAKQIPMRIGVHVLAMIAAGKRLPEHPCPAFPSSNKGAYWNASHICHLKSCTNPDHLTWEPNWANRQRDGCAGGDSCPHSIRCLRSHRTAQQYIDWRTLVPAQPNQ